MPSPLSPDRYIPTVQTRGWDGPARLTAALALGCLALAGCSGASRQAYPETFQDTNTYSRNYPASDSATCEAARRALLSQGYTIGKAQKDGVEGQKNFQVKDDDQQHQVISFHVVCTSDQQASPHTTVFVNAVQDRYIIKKTSASAGVGLSVLGSVSMPFGSYEDSLSKVSSETISAPGFYEGFFDLVQRYLPQAEAGGKVAPPQGAAANGAGATPSPAATPASTPASPPAPTAAPTPAAKGADAPADKAATPAATPAAAPAAADTGKPGQDAGATSAGQDAGAAKPAHDPGISTDAGQDGGQDASKDPGKTTNP
ncbi:hypothetical protein CAL26_00150 [Bordetella genomosp. 9]|uniref:DUF2242 domain-containing protein n=1 Tax=Bordetella genomosp. 9 TaxID=1416803 RepID=A0A261RL81_9BORD|nr:DUF2242 domain-containing protein [Bordetella genomosp. 9]OZI25816.1 hypothetical protein CAL26_00150 [Bordetella genomosp. 9]